LRLAEVVGVQPADSSV
jgi:hypothetical protein